MYVLNADHRNIDIKVKKLREAGIVPGCVYGGKLNETLLVQISNKEVNKLLREKTVGGQVSLEIAGKKMISLLKEVSISPVGGQIEHLSFQSLIADEPVHSTAQIILINEEQISDVIRQSLFEISIKALPAHLVEEIRIDLTGMSAGTVIRVEDLEIAKNKEVEILTAIDTLVVSIVDKDSVKDTESEAEEVLEEEETAKTTTK
ncbi:MAG: 50S ribosomal protein L25 [Clostridia bacterium]|nr:50S ribosomal protein L25 [Clostridia bacterium]